MVVEFVVARNPQEDSALPYLLYLPIDGGVILKARDTWPRSARVYCHRFEDDWPDDADVVEKARVASIRRRGASIDLVLDRSRLSRSQFVFTQVRGRPAIFWQTRKAGESGEPRRPDPTGSLRDRSSRGDRYTRAVSVSLLRT